MLQQSMTSDEFRSIIIGATIALQEKVEDINALNVFPVPDGDTGTNMFLTMKAIEDEFTKRSDIEPAEIVNVMARGALLGARGNSGVILAQFFQGLATVLGNKSSFDVTLLVEGISEARSSAYKAVGQPVEGTMLTVIRDMEEAIKSLQNSDIDMVECWRYMCAAARKSVSETPMLLPILKEAGVVDAGGQGLSVLIEGALNNLVGETNKVVNLVDPVTRIDNPKTMKILGDEASHGAYGYCTQFLLQDADIDIEMLREEMQILAESTVVIGSKDIARVHVHVVDPGPVISRAVSLGTLSEVSIVNMDDQHQEFVSGEVDANEIETIGVLSIVTGEGFREVFLSSGAASVLEGGDTMNPSTEEILNAVEAIEADNVIILPNNGNIITTAEQVISISSKRVAVIPSRSMPEGVSAILNLNVEDSMQTNIYAMERAINEVKSGAVCVAQRNANLDGIDIVKGQFIGLLGNNIVISTLKAEDALLAITERAFVEKGCVITLYWGGDISEYDAGEAANVIQKKFIDVNGVEVEVVFGGQPYYNYVVSFE